MGSVGNAYGNAPCESCFATLECELIDRTQFRPPVVARMGLLLIGLFRANVKTAPERIVLEIDDAVLGGRQLALFKSPIAAIAAIEPVGTWAGRDRGPSNPLTAWRRRLITSRPSS